MSAEAEEEPRRRVGHGGGGTTSDGVEAATRQLGQSRGSSMLGRTKVATRQQRVSQDRGSTVTTVRLAEAAPPQLGEDVRFDPIDPGARWF